MTKQIRKKLSLTLIAILVFSANLLAQQPETFDVATFQAPKGWDKQTGEHSIQFSTADKDAYCLVTLFRSLPGLGTPKENFDASWDTIVKTAVTVSAAPQMFPSDPKGEWLIVGGFAPFEKSGEKGVALLYTASGYGKMVNALVLTNTQAYEAAITAFFESVSLKKLAVENPPQVPANQNGSQPSLTGNFWKKGGISKGLLGHSDLSPGTFSDTYHFFSNGTYKFTKVNSQYTAPKWYLENEEGTYTVTGNTITLTSKKAAYSQHRINREDPPLKSGNLPLTTVQYRFEFWKADGNWRLLLSPVDGNETKRDGTFSFWRNGEAQRTYQYHLVDAKGNLIQ